MTERADRQELNRALAKAIAYHDCSKPEKAAAWAARLAQLLGAKGILTAEYRDSRPEC